MRHGVKDPSTKSATFKKGYLRQKMDFDGNDKAFIFVFTSVPYYNGRLANSLLVHRMKVLGPARHHSRNL